MTPIIVVKRNAKSAMGCSIMERNVLWTLFLGKPPRFGFLKKTKMGGRQDQTGSGLHLGHMKGSDNHAKLIKVLNMSSISAPMGTLCR